MTTAETKLVLRLRTAVDTYVFEPTAAKTATDALTEFLQAPDVSGWVAVYSFPQRDSVLIRRRDVVEIKSSTNRVDTRNWDY